MALAYCSSYGALDFTRANDEYTRALALAPGNARVLLNYGRFAVYMGRTEPAIAAARHAVVLDPRDGVSHRNLGVALSLGHPNKEALAAFQDALALDPEDPVAHAQLGGLAYYALGDFERARCVV